MKTYEVRLLGFGELWLFPAEPALGVRDGHSFPHSGTDEVGFELANHAQDVEQQFAHWLMGS
ncbi:hypothetical protein J3A64_001657 [Pseudarthrobacter sp. PvP004]|nr:hypothetical protein [Pseudarthrobacter sp. PvP004]